MLEVPWEPPRIDEKYLVKTTYCDPENDEIRSKTAEIISDAKNPKETAIAIYKFIRDDIRWGIELPKPAEEVLRSKRGICLNQANLHIAMLRSAKIPARYHLMEFKKDMLRIGITDKEFYDSLPEKLPGHWIPEVYLDDKWIGCDATLDKNILPTRLFLEWNGEKDLCSIPPTLRGDDIKTSDELPAKRIESNLKGYGFDVQAEKLNSQLDSIRKMSDDDKYELFVSIWGKTAVEEMEKMAKASRTPGNF